MWFIHKKTSLRIYQTCVFLVLRKKLFLLNYFVFYKYLKKKMCTFSALCSFLSAVIAYDKLLIKIDVI